MSTLPPSVQATLDHRVRQVQRDSRIPGIAVGVVRDGELVWSIGVGAGDVAQPPAASSLT